MELIWLDSNPNPDPNKYPDEYRRREHGLETVEGIAPEFLELKVTFNHFGRGALRQPSFAVQVNWIDVVAFLREFMAEGHPTAAYILRALKMAAALENAGWSPDDPPPDDLDDILSISN